MSDSIKIDEIYDKNLNFLIGSGASYGLLPTLELKIQGNDESKQTIETLASYFQEHDSDYLNTLLFMYYYRECIEPALLLDESHFAANADSSTVLENYKEFVSTIIYMMERRNLSTRCCNMFTTNYDGCFEFAAEALLKDKAADFILNDGSLGFKTRFLHIKNFNSFVYQTGVFGKHKVHIPQINLLHVHGSTYWTKYEEQIKISYSNEVKNQIIEKQFEEDLIKFTNIVNDETKKISDLNDASWSEKDAKSFWNSYKQLPIVNPTKWKFHETVFEEHYYQMLRHLSYELEKQNSILITFGFSFADEHILKLVQRSLSNPSLQVFVCCYNDEEKGEMIRKFDGYKNISLISSENNLDFSAFNEVVFNLTKKESEDDGN